jgi:hypothetical protein
MGVGARNGEQTIIIKFLADFQEGEQRAMTPEEHAQRVMARSRPDLEGKNAVRWEGTVVSAIETQIKIAIQEAYEDAARMAETTKHDRMAGLLSDQIAAAIRARKP